jgi:GH25 family lysozyme M1 (1,4-beta-N-acetylmuramidase)
MVGIVRRRASSFGLFGLASLAILTGVGAVPTAFAASHKPPPHSKYVEGIDVSHWQGTINWAQVASAGKKFAFIKAAQGGWFVDGKYQTNHAGARAAGIVTGAYDYADPTAEPGQAVAEADFFVAAAGLLPGDLDPVLDLEKTGGLDVPTLHQWVVDWTNEVFLVTGKHAIIYCNRAFWRDNVGDATDVAAAGNKLWLSKGNVTDPSPYVPASNWDGYGWSFWQYTASGTVKGISGAVDLDRLNGTDLTPYQ